MVFAFHSDHQDSVRAIEEIVRLMEMMFTSVTFWRFPAHINGHGAAEDIIGAAQHRQAEAKDEQKCTLLESKGGKPTFHPQTEAESF